MFTRASADTQLASDLSATDFAAILMAVILAANAIWRIRRCQLNSSGLLRANIAMAVVMVLSVSPVYNVLDPLMGGRSFLNCVSHLFMIYVGWQIADSMAQFLQPFDRLSTQPALIRAWVPALASVGTVGSYILLNPTSSRGLDAYDHHPAFVTYWVFTLLPLVLGAFHLLPRMVRLAPMVFKVKAFTAISMSLLWLSLVGVLISVLLYALTALEQSLWGIREAVVTLTALSFAVGFLMATAALPRPKERPRQQSHLAQSHKAPQ